MAKSWHNASTIPLLEYDEANRAEGLKGMHIANSYLFPVTGSPYLRHEDLAIKIDEEPSAYIYHHLERPPLFYWLMYLSQKWLGENELSFRIPSLLAGIILFVIALMVLIKSNSQNVMISGVIACFALIMSKDWWLSSQMAMMDTSLTLFMSLSVWSIIRFQETSDLKQLYKSGIWTGLSILVKGQPAAMLLLPILYLVFKKLMRLEELVKWLSIVTLTILPWIWLSIDRFGLENIVSIFFLGLAKQRTFVADISQNAPFYWYIRWWLGSFRTGIVLFVALVIKDAFDHKLDNSKKLLLTYIVGGFLAYSMVENKVWWYVLPMMVAATMYIFKSTFDALRQKRINKISLVVVLFMTILPFPEQSRNVVVLICGSLLTLAALVAVNLRIEHKSYQKYLLIAIILGLANFGLKFPTPKPIYFDSKSIGEYYQKIESPKCLYVKDIPYESILFYSNSKTIEYWQENLELRDDCISYLITTAKRDEEIIVSTSNLKLYKLQK